MRPQEFWYIKLLQHAPRGNRKQPLDAWGGYDTEFHSNEDIYSYEETVNSPHDNWGIVGYRGDPELLVADIDFYKTDKEPADFSVPDEVGIVKSVKPDRDDDGVHIYLLVEEGVPEINAKYGWMDLKGEYAKGHVVSPFHGNSQYEHTKDWEARSFMDVDTLNKVFQLNGQGVLEGSSGYSDSYSFNRDEEAPDEIPKCYERALQQRASIPRDGTFDGNPFLVDAHAAMLGVAHGYSKEELMTHFKTFYPKDGWDGQETEYQLDLLLQKELMPPSITTLRKDGIFGPDEICSDDKCEIPYHDGSQESDLETLVPTDSNGNPKIHDEPPEQWDTDEPLSLLSTARGGKTYTLTGMAVESMDDEELVYLAPTHEEAQETYKKFTEHHGVDAVWLCGERYARENYDVKTTGDPNPGLQIRTPSQAQHYDDCNAYATLIQNAQDAQVVVTVPELVDKIGDYDMLLSSEESALDRMTTGASRLLEAKRSFESKAHLSTDITNLVPHLERMKEKVEEQDALHSHHLAVREAVNSLLNIAWKVENWTPATWTQVDNQWRDLWEDIEREVKAIDADYDFEIQKVKNYLSGHTKVESPILDMLHSDGLFAYKNESGRYQLFLCSEPHTLTHSIPDDVTVWLAGFARKHLDTYHEIIGGETPTPYAYKPKTPVLKDTRVIKYTGGKNGDHQTGILRRGINRMQKMAPNPGIYTVEGSSDKAAANAQCTKFSWVPSNEDGKEDLRRAAGAGMQTCAAVTSRFSKGIDTAFFEVGAMTHGRFATPVEDYVIERDDDPSFKLASVGQAAQNALLRASNTPSEDTGITPVITGDRQVPDVLFEVLEAYGAKIVELDDIKDAVRMVVHFVDPAALEAKMGPEESEEFHELVEITSDDETPA